MLKMMEDLAMAGESTQSTVQGVSTKVHEIKLDKYKESGSLIEKGCTTDSVSTPFARKST